MRYFFFGTLMDQDVLSVVLGRRPAPGMIRSASLAGYRRFRARCESYPVLVAASGLWFRVRMVWFMTFVSLTAYAGLLFIRRGAETEGYRHGNL